MFRSVAALLICATAASADTLPQIAAGLADADPDVQLRAAISACLALRNDPPGVTALVETAPWDVDVPPGSGSGFAVFRRDGVFLSLGSDAQVCSVMSNGHSTGAMNGALSEALAAAGIGVAGTGQDPKGCQVLDLDDGRKAGIYGAGTDYPCASDADSNLFIYPGTP